MSQEDNLQELYKILREKWKNFHSLRWNYHCLEFSIDAGNDGLHWFSITQAPEEIEKIANRFVKIGGQEIPSYKFQRTGANQNIDPEYVKKIGGISEELMGKDD